MTRIKTQEDGGNQLPRTPLEEILREGARRMLMTAIENEVREYVEAHGHLADENGHRLVVRNGSMPERDLTTGVGPVRIRQPRVHDRREDHRFTSAILPPYMRRAPSIDALIPALYLKGVSTGDFSEALAAILGDGAAGLSAANIVRLKASWEEDYKAWSKRDLSRKEYVYIWADGIYFNVRLDDDRPCILVIIGALRDGTKELLAVSDGERESKLSWKQLLLDLKNRGLRHGPSLAIADGALGFWAALPEVYPSTRDQRCWVHVTANVLDKLPKKLRAAAKRALQDIYMAETREGALRAFDQFMDVYEVKYPKACNCLRKNKDALFTFYDFPAEHWAHLRTTNPIESTFATVRLRTCRTKGCGSRLATITMVFKLVQAAETHWNRLRGYKRIAEVIEGVAFIDGIHPKEVKSKAA